MTWQVAYIKLMVDIKRLNQEIDAYHEEQASALAGEVKVEVKTEREAERGQ